MSFYSPLVLLLSFSAPQIFVWGLCNLAFSTEYSRIREVTVIRSSTCPCLTPPPSAEHWKPIDPEDKKRYDREFLLGFQNCTASLSKPEGLPHISDVVLDKVHLPSPCPPLVPTSRNPFGTLQFVFYCSGWFHFGSSACPPPPSRLTRPPCVSWTPAACQG